MKQSSRYSLQQNSIFNLKVNFFCSLSRTLIDIVVIKHQSNDKYVNVHFQPKEYENVVKCEFVAFYLIQRFV